MTWDPQQYNRFAAEREQPFWDLAALLLPADAPEVVDLGCGDGRLTRALHERVGATRTTGIDSSPAMLAAAEDGDGVTFVEGDLATWTAGDAAVDVVFANASLQWVGDHESVLERWRGSLAPGGQLAVQVPSNADHPSHTVLADLAPDVPDPVAANVLAPERYAEVLHGLGFAEQHVRLQVYGHVLESSADVVEWVKGTSLTRLGERGRDPAFVDEYRGRLLAVIGDRSPYFYAFKRILMWARLG